MLILGSIDNIVSDGSDEGINVSEMKDYFRVMTICFIHLIDIL